MGKYGAVEVMRLGAFVLCVVELGWLTGMVLAYWRLLREDKAWAREVSIPLAMLPFTLGYALMLAAQMWRSVEFYHSPFTYAVPITVAGLVFGGIGMAFMHRGITERQRSRRQSRLRDLPDE